MPRLKLLLLLVLAACVQTRTSQVQAFRPAAAPIYSSAAFDARKLEGNWTQSAAFVAGEAVGCDAGRASFGRTAGGLMLSARLCLNGAVVDVSGPVSVSGPGRLSVPGMADWWVLWVDSGYRTLAIGTPDGRFGFVLDRGAISGDRLAAAAEIFDFNGYSKTRLRPF